MSAENGSGSTPAPGRGVFGCTLDARTVRTRSPARFEFFTNASKIESGSWLIASRGASRDVLRSPAIRPESRGRSMLRGRNVRFLRRNEMIQWVNSAPNGGGRAQRLDHPCLGVGNRMGET